MNFIEAKLAEGAFDYSKLGQLNAESEAYERELSDLPDGDLMDELKKFKSEVGIKWRNSFKL